MPTVRDFPPRLLARRWSMRALAPTATCLVVALASCGESFEPSCVAPSCEGQGPSCRSYDFEGGVCPADWAIAGNTEYPDVTADCVLGKLHVAAGDTLDITGRLSLDAPSMDYAMHVSARIAVFDWDEDTVLRLDVDGAAAFDLRAEIAASGNPVLSVCDERECPMAFAATLGTEYLFEFDVSAAGVVVAVDCEPLGTLAAVELPTDVNISLEFGHMDARPIDGTLDDVVISFR